MRGSFNEAHVRVSVHLPSSSLLSSAFDRYQVRTPFLGVASGPAGDRAEDGGFHRLRRGAASPMLGLLRPEELAMKTILCAVDESPGAAEAVAVASGLSADLGLRLVLAHIVYGSRRANGAAIGEVQAPECGQRLLERIARTHSLEGGADRRAEVGDRASELSR